MTRRLSDLYAPYGRCDKCGWKGQDWAFKYQGLCSKCYKQWRKERAEERRKLKLPNENVEVADGVSVTRNVRDRLERRAHSDVPLTRRSNLAEWCEGIGLCMSLIAMLVLIFTYNFYPKYAPLLVTCTVLGFVMARVGNHIQVDENVKRMPIVNARLEELALERQRKSDETNAFYASPEWRLIREQVIKEQGRMCQECGRRIRNDYDLTVDHIKPRSKFPEFSLDNSNLQVLCRRCNSAKAATYDESSMTPEKSKGLHREH